MSDEMPRVEMETDIVCVGFGPAAGGFLTTLTRGLMNDDGTFAAESKVMPGMPPQVICYERADDIGFGVSGVVTKGRSIRATFPDLDLSQIPMACEVREEKVLFLTDPVGASRRPGLFRLADKILGGFMKDGAYELPYIPKFLEKHPGMLFSIGQLNQWVGANLMGTGLAQIWPSSPVAEPLVEGTAVKGVRMADQGVDKDGTPNAGYMPGMDMKAALTVVADGPVGPVGRELNRRLGMPGDNCQREWAVGMKCVVELPEGCDWQPGTVLHTIGYPEPEIFGFLYVYPGNVASLGIFVPSWFDNPVRTAYRYMQHWMLHPYLWKRLQGGTLRSWGAKSLNESGKHGEPILCGDGFARIGEGSGSTNVLTGSGVDEAWATGVQLGEAVLELLKSGRAFTKENLENTYVSRRRASWVEKEAEVAKKSRDGFTRSVLSGFLGMGLTGLTNGLLNMPGKALRPQERIPSVEDYYRDVIPAGEIAAIRADCAKQGKSLHDALMDRAGWPEIPLDGQLLVSHQDALLMGGKVQANPGYADHVRFADPARCATCREQVCIEACSGQAIYTNPDGGAPLFDREKCVHCGACLWNCSKSDPNDPERTNVQFRAGSGGLHSVEN
ncbi:Electron-transferring-flavoprotein dehydrogenase [Pseudodesulfovibrio mercurii]|uniref:Electron transfer flavoprotein-ubiquinone oxidoreductase n=1 Tax=Pseudodesulfovibrio mercurii TaxID=641491 RepID=F0JBF8_9BACT|nr:4Fe-4S ferredoxin [Pseudodesulfovibrio mercurii]EGB14277.1 Electron-transferring-flavoprotein dehydrogenase [Pseudodesulfovibrio mercurii]